MNRTKPAIPLIRTGLLAGLLACGAAAHAQAALDADALRRLDREVEQRLAPVEPEVIAWRRDIHRHPELSGQEVRTSALVAAHLRKLGLEVSTGVGGHGVVALLEGGLPGKVVALRADMDALPVKEATGLPFASTVVEDDMGQPTPVMHACGHDAHTAIMMGVAEVLAGMKSRIRGTVKFIFQPSEEGLSEPAGAGVLWGAKGMVAAGVMERPKVDAVFGLHITSQAPVGVLGWRIGPGLASADTVHIRITGKQTHGSSPWAGIDPIVVSAQIVMALQTVVSRSLNISKEPAVLSIGSINGGNRENIVPESVDMLGTLRTYDEDMRADAKRRIVTIAQSLAAASGAHAQVDFGPTSYGVTSNPAPLTEAMLPVLGQAAGGNVTMVPKAMGSEDFSEYQKVAPGMFYMLGGKPAGRVVGINHAPDFDFDESALRLGVKSMSMLALAYLEQR